MEKCKINITIGTGSYEIEVDSTQLPETMDQLKEFLKKTTERLHIDERTCAWLVRKLKVRK